VPGHRRGSRQGLPVHDQAQHGPLLGCGPQGHSRQGGAWRPGNAAAASGRTGGPRRRGDRCTSRTPTVPLCLRAEAVRAPTGALARRPGRASRARDRRRPLPPRPCRWCRWGRAEPRFEPRRKRRARLSYVAKGAVFALCVGAPLAAVMDVIGRPRARRSGQVSAMAWVAQSSSSSARGGVALRDWMPEPTIRCLAVRVARISSG
jgi:hypothetical protein